MPILYRYLIRETLAVFLATNLILLAILLSFRLSSLLAAAALTYAAPYAASSAGSGSGLAGLSKLVGDEGTLTWGASGSTWTLALAFEATPDAHSS